MRSARLWAAVWLLCTPAVLKAVPHSMSYQAILKTSAGVPVANGFHVVTFSLYKSGTGGSALWTEIQTVATQGGLFSTTLGTTVPIPDSAFADTAAYLELAVASDPPLSPRVRLESTPFSLVSSSVRGGGPVELKYEDVLNEELNTYSLDVTPPPGGDQGKGIRKNLTVNLRTHQSSKRESMAVDSGLVTEVDISDDDDSLHYMEIAHIDSDELVQSGQAVAIPAFMKNARKAKTAEAAEMREILDTDSGYYEKVTLETPNGTTELSVTANPSTSGAIAVPSLIESRKSSNGSASAESRGILDPDSGYSEVVSIETADLTTTHSHGSGHTREHVLLARQVGVPTGGTRTNQFTTEITDDSAHTQWRWSESSMDTSDVDLTLSGSDQVFMMATKAPGATKWPNIVLKRGAAATEMIVSHSLAGAGNVLYASADASGAKLGINTDSPSTEFHLVGSGCYTGTFGACSDRRFKDHISTLRDPLSTLRRLRGVNYTWKQEEFPEHQFPSGQQVGLIAQEVEKVVPGVVTTGDDGYKSVDYAKLVPLLIEAVKAQQRQIDELKAQLQGTGRLMSAGN